MSFLVSGIDYNWFFDPDGQLEGLGPRKAVDEALAFREASDTLYSDARWAPAFSYRYSRSRPKAQLGLEWLFEVAGFWVPGLGEAGLG